MKVDSILDFMELDFANAMLAEVKLRLSNEELTNELYIKLLDEYESVYVDSAIAGVKEFTESCESYFLDEQGLMRVKSGCNWFMAQFDGCKPSEYYGELNIMMR